MMMLMGGFILYMLLQLVKLLLLVVLVSMPGLMIQVPRFLDA